MKISNPWSKNRKITAPNNTNKTSKVLFLSRTFNHFRLRERTLRGLFLVLLDDVVHLDDERDEDAAQTQDHVHEDLRDDAEDHQTDGLHGGTGGEAHEAVEDVEDQLKAQLEGGGFGGEPTVSMTPNIL
jgi:uncharacterized protein YyaL (SSP411 family)